MGKRKILSIIFAVIINFSLIVFAWAGIRIDKPKIRISVPPGSYESGEIKVENTGKEPITITVYLEDWVYSRQDGGKEFMPKGTMPLSCSNWITFYPADFTLPPNGVQIVRYTVNVPEDTKGGHYSVMFFETGGGNVETVNEEGNNVVIWVLNRLGALFYVEPGGTIQKTAEIKNLNITEKLNDFIVTADFFNMGNTDITATGTFNVIDDQGFVYARGEFDEVYTLPKDKATLLATAKSVNLKIGTYDMLITLEFQNGGTLVKEATFSVSGNGAISFLNLKN